MAGGSDIRQHQGGVCQEEKQERGVAGEGLGGPVAPWLDGRGGAGECQGVQELAWPPHQGPTLLCGESGAQP